jgi:hypothetical protein
VILNFTIRESGQVASVSAENHLPDAEVAACITRIFEQLRFPARDIDWSAFPAVRTIDVAVRVPLVLGSELGIP